MTAVVSVSETISELTTLVQAGNIREARKLGKTLINKAEARDLWLIAQIAHVLESRPRTAVDILRQWWCSAPSEADKAIIFACAPKDGEQRHRPKPANGRVLPRTRHHRPSAVTTTVDVMAKRARSRQEQADAADFARYRAESAGVADGDQVQDRDDRRQAEQVYASGIDYDRAALYRTGLEFRCLFCNVEREKYDLHAERMQAGHGDDGLCQECRETRKDGIPELPAGHSAADAIDARCSFIWERAVTASAARVFLQGEWKRAVTPAVREAIADYARANLPQEQPAEAPAANLGTCELCPERRTAKDVRGVADDDGLCAECRALLAELAAEDEAAMTTVAEAPAELDAEPEAEQAERPEYCQHRAPSKRKTKRQASARAAAQADRQRARKAERANARAAKRR
jgi:PAS domain-containing protein